MPPKRSDLIHVTFHFYRSAILLSLPSTSTVESLKTSLLPALVPLHNLLPSPPSSPDDIQLYEEKPLIEGEEEREAILLTRLDDGVDDRKTTIGSLGWRWKKVFVSFKQSDGSFSEPVFTIPDNDDEEPADGGGEEES